MNATRERLPGTLRRELLDRMLILSEAHLRAISICVTAVDLDVQRVRRKTGLNSLINEYSRAA